MFVGYISIASKDCNADDSHSIVVNLKTVTKLIYLGMSVE